jgi:hypothetical protein
MAKFASAHKIQEHKAALNNLVHDIAQSMMLGNMSRDEMRILVDRYYAMQENRKRSGNQARALSALGHSVRVIRWLMNESEMLEESLKKIIKAATVQVTFCRWAQSVKGIGPVLSAGLYAHLDVTKTKTAGGFWRFAGLDPTSTWNKKERRPWNAKLKTICWLIGESFVKVGGREDPPLYSIKYIEKKRDLWLKNASGGFADRASHIEYKYKDSTEAKKWVTGCYKIDMDKIDQWISNGMKSVDIPKEKVECGSGVPMLSPGHIQAMAKRYTVKLFLSHCFDVLYWLEYGESPPKPYILTQEGHVHSIAPPNLNQFEELKHLEDVLWRQA